VALVNFEITPEGRNIFMEAFENMRNDFIDDLASVQLMAGEIFADRWRTPQGFDNGNIVHNERHAISVEYKAEWDPCGEVNSCGEVTLGAPFTCSLPFELEEDTPEAAYERAMKGI